MPNTVQLQHALSWASTRNRNRCGLKTQLVTRLVLAETAGDILAFWALVTQRSSITQRFALAGLITQAALAAKTPRR